MTMWYQITKADEMSYLGAKSGSGVYQTIINLMPPHDTYIEAFLGTGAIMRKRHLLRKILVLISTLAA
ncbi:hypothetical protein L1D61_26435 [Vibrio mediterranei]|nr:hypothetical protein [Vibrio mediterranei]